VLSECWSISPDGKRDNDHFVRWISTTTRAWMDAENRDRGRRRKPKLDWEHLNGDDWVGKTCNPNSQRVWVEYTKLTGYGLHMPQKLVVLAAGTGDDAKTLCHAKDGDLGRDAPALSMIECFDFLYDLKINFPNTFFVMYGMGYDFTEIMRELPYEVAWEIQNQMPFSSKALKPEERDEPDVQRETFYITPKTPDGKPRTCYGLNYLNGKWFKIGRISNVPDIIPEGWPWYREVEKSPRAGLSRQHSSQNACPMITVKWSKFTIRFRFFNARSWMPLMA
jgi:hypothetical protein